MMLDKYNNWRNTVIELNDSATKISEDRMKCYSWMASKIKNVFKDTHNPVPRVHFEPDCSEIICKWDDVDLMIPVNLILDLHMPFDFHKKISDDGEWEKQLIFYPLEEV